MSDVAGRPLILRQLEWLHACGFEHFAVEIASGSVGEEVITSLEQDPIGRHACLVPTGRITSPRALAARAGFPADAPIVVLDHDVFGDVDLVCLCARASEGETVFRFDLPASLTSLRAGTIRVLRAGELHSIRRETGWAVAVREEEDLHRLSYAVLDDALPTVSGGWRPQVHATCTSPGVWVARGASVDPTAVLTRPVFVGANASISAGARIGPRAVIGAHALIDRNAVVADASIAPSVIVGEGVAMRSCDVRRDGRVVDRGAEPMAVEVDPLLIAAPGGPARSSAMVRAFAAVALATFGIAVVLASPIIGLSLLRSRRLYDGARSVVAALLETTIGTRSLIGVSASPLDAPGVAAGVVGAAQGAAVGLFDVERELAGAGSSALARVGARAWYARNKSLRVDLRLASRAATRWLRTREQATRQVASRSGGRSAPRNS